MKIIKRNGKEVDFDINKIKVAIKKASDATETQSLSESQIENIAEYVEFKVSKLGRVASVEEIQDIVQHQIMASGNFDIAFNKLKLESEFQSLSPGGAISYVEVPNMQDNIPAVLQVMNFIYDNIMYAELNTKSDYCQKCGYDGEILIENVDNKLIWKCPYCGNTDQDTMNVARRTCGYIGTHYWNSGRTEEIKDRVLHL